MKELTIFQSSGLTKEVILVLITGIEPGGCMIFPPNSLLTSKTAAALFYTSSVLTTT